MPEADLARRESILTKRQIEPSLNPERGRCRARHDPRDAVIAQPRRSTKHEGVAGLERHRLDRIAPPCPAEEETRRVADR